MLTRQWRRLSAAAAAAIILCWLTAATASAKNAIVMVADGAGFNTWDAVSMYQGKWDAAKSHSTQVYDGPGWVKYACSTFPLNTSKTPTRRGVQDPNVVYDAAKAWSRQDRYAWLSETYTDSAAAATAFSTGRKTYNNAINWSDLGRPISPTTAEAAKLAGKAVGVVTTVSWSHATPAALSNAQLADRDDYVLVATQMLRGGTLDVIMGAGNPDYDNNGAPVRGKKEYKYVGGQSAWRAIEAARARRDGAYLGFRPVSTKAEFTALLSGPVPAKVLGTAQVGTTLQQARDGAGSDDPAKDTPLNANVPTLAAMAKGALRVLAQRPQGFFLLIEGGAVDWANHKQQLGRMIQEQTAFLAAVQTVVDWVDANSSWDDTLLILTADHETGLLWGPRSDTEPFDPIVNQGPGQSPGVKFNSKNHSNSLTPLYAKGAGSELLGGLVVGADPVRGPYVDNTAVGKALLHAVENTKDTKR